jgi:hypothetical protein
VGRRMIPSLVLLVVIGAYLKTRGVLFEGVFIGLTRWLWVACARVLPAGARVFQEPFSSCNPVFRADRVFELIRAS